MKRNLLSIMLAGCIVFGSVMTATGSGFRALGNRAISMGGAGVAYSSGSYAAYFNPALLATPAHTVEVDLSVGAGFRENNIADHMDTLADIGIDDAIDRFDDYNYSTVGSVAPDAVISGAGSALEVLREDVLTIQNTLRSISDRNGLSLMPSSALGVQAKNFGFGVYGLSDASATAIVDGERLDIVFPVNVGGNEYYVEYDPESDNFIRRDQQYYDDYSLDSALESETTRLLAQGVAYMEIPVGYARQYNTSWGELSVGGALKIITGNTYKLDKAIDSESEDISDDIEDYEKSNTTLGVDLGVLLDPATTDNLLVGLTLKNINNPEFDFIDGSSMNFEPTLRVGAAYTILLDRLTFALDLDVTSNETLIPGYKEQYIGGGVDYAPVSWFSLRGGLMTNMKESDEGVILTAGLGIGAKSFQLDLAGQYSTKEGSFDGKDFPRYGRIQLSLVSKWF
jgi:hypothetical protein